MKLRATLKRALTVHFLLVAMVPTLAFGLVAISLLQNHLLDGLRERNRLLAQDISEETGLFLYEVMLDLQHVRDTCDTDGVILPDAVDRFLEMTVNNSQFFESLYILDTHRRVRFLGLMPDLAERREDYRFLDLSTHALFQESPAIELPTWSNSFVSVVTGEPSITLALPLRQGTLLGNISLERLSTILARYAIGSEAQFAIVDKSGTLVGHSDPVLAMQRLNLNDHPEVRQALDGLEVTVEGQHRDSNLLESVARIPVSGWVVWAGVNLDAVSAPLDKLVNLMVGVMMMAIAMAGVVAFVNSRRLALPIAALGERTARIADGEYSFDFRSSGFHEIDELANNFRGMSKAIRDREASILASESRFRHLVNSIDGIVWEMEYPSLRVLFVSRKAQEFLQYPLRDWLEETEAWQEMIYHADRLRVLAQLNDLVSQKREFDLEFRMNRADGAVLWIHNLVTVVRDDQAPSRLIGVMIDVTRQKELDRELRRSEQNYREIFNATADAIFIHDAHTGRILDVNQAMLEMFEVDYATALTGDIGSFSQGVSPYSVDEGRLKVQKALMEGPQVFEWRARRTSGELFWVEVALKRARIGDGDRVLALVRDISERKRAQQQLEELNERLQLLIDRMPIGCIVWSPDFTVELWNPQAERIFGYTSEEMLGQKPYGRIVAEEVQPHVAQIWKRLVDGDTSAHSENDNRTRDGRTITCEWYNTPIKGGGGTSQRVISMVQDISERKASEMELARYRTHLEELVDERTRQLNQAHAELVQKERLAVLGQLTTTVSHEIRNPLGTVANALYLIRDEVEARGIDQLERPLALAERNVQRCDGIISELLDFSKRREARKVPLEIDPWLQELLAEMAWPDRIHYALQLDAAAAVMADPERLRRALVNVVTNAVHAMEAVEDREGMLKVSTRVEAGRVLVCLADNGIGMSPEVLRQIYEPMYSTKTFGVGLGVPIIKNIIEDHGGTVHYQSDPAVGTCVTLKLPQHPTGQA